MFIEAYKKIIVTFWFVWWLIAFVTDFLGALHVLKLIDSSWVVKSGNYAGLLEALKIFNAPNWVAGILYVCIIVWLFIIVIFFGKALLKTWQAKANALEQINYAFLISMALWLAFFIADQLILNFSLEENHMVQGGFELLSWMSLYLFLRKE